MTATCCRRMPALALLLSFACSVAHAARHDVLVVVNDNSIDSPQVGAHYAQRRDVPMANIVHVKVPNQYYITWAEFQSLRDQILRFGICPSVPAGSRPAACGDTSLPIYTAENIQALTAATGIRYIVTTRGVPTRMKVDGSTLFSPTESTSVDNYLKFWLARHLTADVNFGTFGIIGAPAFNERARAFGNGDNMRIVAPALDGEYIVGRIDGVDLPAAKALVDRAISVEADGWYGKLFGSNFGSTGGVSWWRDYSTSRLLYGDTQTAWRYAFAPFGEERTECRDYGSPSHYWAFAQTDQRGKSPAYCLAQFNKATPNETIPGNASSRQPKPTEAAVYFGSLDGHTVAGGFNTLLNWRKNDSCTVTLCDSAADPDQCRATSTDPYKEINTDCVGVADGFFGYNFQSFPVSILGNWPTGWSPASVDQNDVPVVSNAIEPDGNDAAWFYQNDEIANPSCYGYSNGVLADTQQACPASRKIGLGQYIGTSSADINNPPTYRLSFQLKGQGIPANTTITAALQFTYPKSAGTACPAGLTGQSSDTSCRYDFSFNSTLPAGDSSWTNISRDITPPANTGLNYNTIFVTFRGTITGGRAGFDAVALTRLSDSAQLITNGSFDQGHRQASNGDYAANFLGRLGGAAFWGSLSHHQSLGHSFDQTSLGTLVYFIRGLPLGDAVWLGESNVSGIYYGDPLYSPLAVRLVRSTDNPWNFVRGQLPLSGSVVNGRDAARVATTYSVDYCAGSDFFTCGDSGNPWLPTGITGAGGQENIALGTWDTSTVAPGQYVMRLRVTSTNAGKGKSQSFYDYARIAVYNDTSDADADGLTDLLEMSGAYGTNPLTGDTDNDGLLDGAEVNTYHTDPIRADSDQDGLLDGNEVNTYGSDPLKVDTDGDGYDDGYESYYGGNPVDGNSLPLAITSVPVTSADAELTYTYQVHSTWSNATYSLAVKPEGMSIDASTGLLTWTPGYALVGQPAFVIVQVQAGGFTNWQNFSISVDPANTGDINEDGLIDDADVLLSQRMALGLITPTARQSVRADLYHDGVIDASDVLLLQRKALGL